MAARSVLVCVGPATQAFLTPLGVTIPVGQVPGLLAVTSRPSVPLGRVVHAPGIHVRPDAGGGLLLGAEDVDTLAATSGSPVSLSALLLERAARVFPPRASFGSIDSRIGVRPMPDDRRTIAGRIPGSPPG
jgi:glycine/D-amino acid oxidase-like deaminating enzyme